MKTYIFLFAISMIIGSVLTALVKKYAAEKGFVDVPDRRKVHKEPVPRLGGIAIFIGLWTPLFLIYFLENQLTQVLFASVADLFTLFAASLAMLILGIYDDIKGANAYVKFTVQGAVALFLFFAGFKISLLTNPFTGGALFIGEWLGFIITILWIVGIINAINLIDGLDGLAGGVSLIITFTILMLSFYLGNPFFTLFMVCLAGAILGFLYHNVYPAKIFMGDSGSMVLGLILAAVSLKVGQKSATMVAIFTPLLALALPIGDTAFAIIRRFKNRLPIFSSDKGHIHHELLRMGFSQSNAVYILYGACALFCLMAFIVTFARNNVVAYILFLVAVLSFTLGRNLIMLFFVRHKVPKVPEEISFLQKDLKKLNFEKIFILFYPKDTRAIEDKTVFTIALDHSYLGKKRRARKENMDIIQRNIGKRWYDSFLYYFFENSMSTELVICKNREEVEKKFHKWIKPEYDIQSCVVCPIENNPAFSGIIICGNSSFYNRKVTVKDLYKTVEFAENFKMREGLEEFV